MSGVSDSPSVRSFVFDQPEYRVILGAGAFDRLPDELARLVVSRALIICTPDERQLAHEAANRLGTSAAGIFDEAVMHHPVETVRAAQRMASSVSADCCVTVGGGTTTGTGKAVVADSGLPLLAVPTTYAGSEVTPIYGVSDRGVKTVLRNRKVVPRSVVYDPVLTLTLAPSVSGPSGMNALAHCVEGLYAFDANPISTLMAAEGIRAMARALPAVVRDPAGLPARTDALYAAWLAGIVLGTVSMGLHHKLCHTLGGTFGLPHAEVHTVLLPHAVAYNREAAPGPMRQAAEALGAADAARGLWDLARNIGAPTDLRSIGMPADGLERAADLAVQNQYPNPQPIERGAIRALLERAYNGVRP
jgi:maleylacetate reductase